MPVVVPGIAARVSETTGHIDIRRTARLHTETEARAARTRLENERNIDPRIIPACQFC
jgi:hypothetical protein